MKAILLLILIFISQIIHSQLIPTPQPTPPVGGQNNTVFDPSTNSCTFLYNGPDGTLNYTYSPSLATGDIGSLNALTANIGNSFSFWPSINGGIAIIYSSQWKNPWEHSYHLDSISLNNNILTVLWTLTAHFNHIDVLYDYKYTINIEGRTLIIKVEKVGNGTDCAAEFNLDRSYSDENLYSNKSFIIGVPYLTLFNILYTGDYSNTNDAGNVFTSMFFDWTSTNASRLVPRNTVFSNTSVFYSQQAEYLPKTDGNRNPLNETIYLTVSPKLEDVFPNIPNPVSPSKDQSIKYIVWDYWKPFSLARYDLDSIYTSNINNLWLIFHKWDVSCGTFSTGPDFFPACQLWGNNDTLTSLRSYVSSKGSLFSLHENYMEYFVTSPTYNVDKLSKNSNSQYIPNWFDNNGNPVSYCIKPTKILDVMNDPGRAPIIHSTFNTTAGYLDVHSSYDPSAFVDYDVNQNNAGKFTEALHWNSQIAGVMRNYCNGGPVSGEGLAHFLYTGYYDDFEAQIHTAQSLPGFRYVGTDHAEAYGGYYKPLLVDFDLRKMRDKAFVHGVGYYDRFFYNINNGNCYGISVDSELIYTATELAYAHGGFFTTGGYIGPFNFLEQTQIQYNHVFPMQSFYAYPQITSILYNDDGILLTGSDYIKKYPDKFNCFPWLSSQGCDGNNFMSQVRIEYDNGVIVCVNRHPTKTWIVNDIPSSGWYNYHVLGNDGLYTGETGLPNYALPPGSGWVCYSPVSPSTHPKKLNVTKPGIFKLHQNYPNPFNPQTQITYEIPKDDYVTIKIYNVLGQNVLTLVNNEFKKQGSYNIIFNGKNYASGVYFYRIETGNYQDVRKMVLIK